MVGGKIEGPMTHHAADHTSPSLQQGRNISRLKGYLGKERPLPLCVVSPDSNDTCPKVSILPRSLMILCPF